MRRCDVVERRTSPQRQRLAVQADRLVVVGVPGGLGDQPAEPMQVNLFGRDVDPVAGAGGHQRDIGMIGQGAAQPGDVDLNVGPRLRRNSVTPQQVDQPVDVDERVEVPTRHHLATCRGPGSAPPLTGHPAARARRRRRRYTHMVAGVYRDEEIFVPAPANI